MRGSKKTFLVLIAVFAVVLSGLTITAHAAGVYGNFEIDGNKVDDPGVGDDWLTPNIGAVVFNDPASNSGCPAGTDDNFIGGGSTEESPGTWTFSCGNVPQKDDFTEAGILARKISDTEHWLFLYFDRVSGNGEAHLNFEFNRLATTFDNDNDSSTPEIPERSTGDILITLDATNGGSVTKPNVYKWSGSRTSGTWQLTGGTQVQGVDWDVATDGTGDRFHFAEAAMNLEAFNIPLSCPGLGKGWVKSNSTADFDHGVLKDRTVRKDVSLNNCARKDWEFTVNPVGIAGTKVFAVYTVAGPETRTLELTLGSDGKTYTASDAQVPPGSVTYHFEVRNGTNVVYSSTPATETLAQGETKKNSGSLTYDISLSPDDAENFSDGFAGVPQPHELTAKVFNTADNAGLPFVPVKFENLGSCGSLSTTSGTTDANGEAKTILTSADPCSTSVRAWVNGTGTGATAGFDTGERSDTSTKRFVSYSIAVSPEDVENEQDTDHTFTVTLKKDSGSGEAGLAGATVSVELDAGTTGATITSIPGGTIALDGLSGTCVTDANGQCKVTIHGSTPGTAKLTASYTASNSDGDQVIIKSDGTKRYIAFELTVEPETAENEVGQSHTFTVTLTRDAGSGPDGYTGQSVALTLDPEATGATITSVSGGTIAENGLSATCTTDTNGECTVTINGDSAGTATLSASWSKTLSGGATVTKNDSGDKTYSAFDLQVTPENVENEVDTDHVFTVTLTRDSGSGPAGISGETVDLTLVPGTTGAIITAASGDGTIAGDGLSGTCVTDTNGKCTVTIHGDSPGTATLSASWSDTLSGGGTVTKSDTATKVFSAFDLQVTPDNAQNEVDTDHTFTATLTRDSGSGPAGISGETINFTLDAGTTGATITATSDPGSIAGDGLSATCVTATNGQCTVTIHGDSAGTATLSASWSDTLSGGGTVTKTDTATKVFTGFALDLSPESAENETGTDHTFTATLTSDSGSGSTGVSGETIEFTLDPGTTGATFTATSDPGSIAGDGLSATCVTATNGQCTVTIHGDSPGTATVTATWSKTLSGGGTVTKTDTSTKAFSTFDLQVTPPSAENETGTDHVFTVTLTRDSGSGPAGVEGASVDITLAPGSTGATITAVSAGTIADGGLSATCITDADGKCTVTIHGNAPGTATITASWSKTLSGGGTVTKTDTATKVFTTFDLQVTPPSQTNEVDTDHVFTVTLTSNSGSGAAGIEGATVNLTLDPGTTESVITAVSGGGTIATGGLSGTCITDADGQCTVTIHGTKPGTATLTATWSKTLTGGGTVTKTDTATKTFGEFELAVTPPSATNEVGSNHTFTMTLTRDGSGLSGEEIELVLTRPEGSDVHFTAVSGDGEIADDTHATCITGANGTCTATITGTTPGTVTLTATWHNTIATNGVDQVATATKEFRAFTFTLTPESATNEVGNSHTFTATLTQDTGSGPAGLGGETISFVMTRPEGSDAHFTAVSGDGAIADDTHATCVTADDGTCTATITATTAGQVSVTATWHNETIIVGGITKTDTATKQFLDFTLDVTPPSANNQVGQAHEFTVTLKQDSGSGLTGLAGETVHLVLTGPEGGDGHFTKINGADATGVEADCTTRTDDAQTPADETGTCSVIITSSTSGTYTLTATWNNSTIVVDGASETDTATKTYIAIDVEKIACPTDTSPRGGIVDYSLSFSVDGSGLTNATFTDDLPAGVKFVSASQINGVTPTTPAVGADDGIVKWTFPTIAAGDYTGTIRVTIADDAQIGAVLTNTVTLDADEIGPNSASDDVTVSDAGKSASGRAYGVKLDLLGSEVIAPTPDSDVTNPGELLSIPDPLGSTTPLIKLLSVSESDDSTANQAAYSASATAADVDLNLPGILHLQASSVVAKSSSQATGTSAGSSRGGSLIQNLIVNGHTYGNVTEPTTINVLDPLSGDKLAEVHLLETTRSGAAAGATQPNGNKLFASGITVNGIHVKVHILDLADLIVSRAETQAAFPSGLGCGGTIPSVSGSAYALGVNLQPDSEGGIDLGNVKVAEVNLPITGGQDDAVLADVDVPDVVKATVAEAHTNGEITDTDDDGTAVEAHSLARTNGLNLLAGAIVARVVEATSDSTIASSSGTTTIAHLEIGGTDVCDALGLDSICKPEPNTELLIPGGPIIVKLNEQIPEPGGLTVNAVHIWVLGEGNPFGLPVGADIVISNAHSDAHPAGGTSSAAITDRITTINIKALSSPTALRLKQLQKPVRIKIPAVKVPKLAAPVVKVQEVLRDPASVVQLLNTLTVDEDVLDDALQLVDTLTDPEALLKALDDPATLLEGLSDPAAALDALEQAVGVNTQDPAASDPSTATPEQELAVEVIRALRQLSGV